MADDRRARVPSGRDDRQRLERHNAGTQRRKGAKRFIENGKVFLRMPLPLSHISHPISRISYPEGVLA
jgi:hypothetical protein